MEATALRGTSTAPGSPAALDRAREVQSLLALRLAHRGWAVRVEVVGGADGPEIDCRPYGIDDGSIPQGTAIVLPVSHEPVELQAARILDAIEHAGWTPSVGSSGGWTNPRAGAGIWCVPE